VSWARRPCVRLSNAEWECTAIWLGKVEDCGLELNVFATLAGGRGIDGIMEGWQQNPDSGFFVAPAGVDSAKPYKFTRAEDDPGCPPVV
jgi:hypothetical protein